jgi:hypothetical protein
MRATALLGNQIKGKSGRWVEKGPLHAFVDDANQVVAPQDLKGQDFNTLDINTLPLRPTNPQKVQLVAALIAANSAAYPRLQEHLEALRHAVAMGNEYEIEQSQFQRLQEFINSYSPIDSKMQDFLKKYAADTAGIMNQLEQLIQQDAPAPKPVAMVPTVKRENPVNIKKFGLYRFPFLQQEKLYLGDIEEYPTIAQEWNQTGTHFKIWKLINKLPFLVNGYGDDEYSAVNRVLASQIGKMLGLQCEEVFFGYLHGKCVTLTAFHEAVTLLENQGLELYQLASNYNYLADQKRTFYFLIQHWVAYANMDSETKERFDAHFIDSNGEVFLSNHQQAMFLTPQLMARNLMVKLTITKLNYQSIKDMTRRIGSKDFADIVFSSIPDEFVELHDQIAVRLNKTNFQKKKECFDGNWTRLLEALQEFERMPRV